MRWLHATTIATAILTAVAKVVATAVRDGRQDGCSLQPSRWLQQNRQHRYGHILTAVEMTVCDGRLAGFAAAVATAIEMAVAKIVAEAVMTALAEAIRTPCHQDCRPWPHSVFGELWSPLAPQCVPRAVVAPSPTVCSELVVSGACC